jgi:hypothetical protein
MGSQHFWYQYESFADLDELASKKFSSLVQP